MVSLRLNRAVHEPSDDCANYHCHYHHVDEAPSRRKGAWVCFECLHTFPSGWHLLSDYRRMVWGVYPPGPYRIWRWLTVRRKQIRHCPHCAHDF